MRKLLKTPNDAALTVARVALGGMIFAHGAQKALGWWGGYGFAATVKARSSRFVMEKSVGAGSQRTLRFG